MAAAGGAWAPAPVPPLPDTIRYDTADARFGGHRHANPFFYDLAATGAARPLWGVSGAGLAVRPEARIQRKS